MMNWWLSDVLVDRNTNSEIEKAMNSQKVKSSALARSISGLKRYIFSQIDAYRAKYEQKRAQRQLNQLDDHHLADIGLTRESLFLMSKGEQPVRTIDNAALDVKPVTLELVSDQSRDHQTVDENPEAVQKFDKVA